MNTRMYVKILTTKITLLFLLIFKFFPIDIAFVCNNNYAYMLATCIASLLDNKDESDKINIYVLHPDFTEKTIGWLNTICHKKCSISYIKFDLVEFKNIRKDFNVMTYTKYLIPRLLPQLDKVLYLDVDTIVLTSLKELWNITLKDNYVAAVHDFGDYEESDYLNIKYYRNKYKNKIKLMINAGVMLLNLKKLRENDFEKKFIHEVLYEKHYFGDQPIFFFLFLDHIKYLSPKWNAQPVYFINKVYKTIYSKKQMEEMINNPSIVHFSGKTYFNPLHKFSSLFIHYLYKIMPDNAAVQKLIASEAGNAVVVTGLQISFYQFLKVKLMILKEMLKCC